MSSNESLYPRVAERFSEVLDHVTSDQWDEPTPCDEWTVRDLVTHVIATHRRVYALVDPSDGGTNDDRSLVDQWATVATAMRHSLVTPNIANTLVPGRHGEQPFSQLVGGLLMFDTLCHTWDLAHAIGFDESLDAEAVANAHERLAAVGDAIRVPGGFAPPVESTPNADAQTQFLNFVGRRV